MILLPQLPGDWDCVYVLFHSFIPLMINSLFLNILPLFIQSSVDEYSGLFPFRLLQIIVLSAVVCVYQTPSFEFLGNVYKFEFQGNMYKI